MREIKFRVWLPKTRKMVHFNQPHINFEYGLFALDCATEEYQGIANFPDDYEEALFMQFTGLKDKNGKEIYEGDIVYGNYGYSNSQFEVRWCPDNFQMRLKQTGESLEVPLYYFHAGSLKCEVIGNIYENPNLIKRVLDEADV